MKRWLLAMMVAMVSMVASAQVRFGVKAGINTAEFFMNESLIDADNQRGFTLGCMLDVDLPLPWLSFNVGMQYENRKIENVENNHEYTKTLHMLNIPIHAQAGIGMKSVLGAFVYTGPQFSFNLGNDKIWNHTYNINATQLSWNIGGGVQICKNLQLIYNYNVPIGDTAEVNTSEIYDQVRHSDVKENIHQVILTYFF